MRIELLTIILNHFKGVQHFEFIADGLDAIISGSNATGKTSVFDAWLWLLFDMDSRGNKGAEAAKTTAGTDFVHYLTHEVSGTISVDGKTISLRKTLAENWVKPHGKDKQEFAGNAAKYWIDDVPMLLKDYSAYINSLITADLFKIISDPFYFSEQLTWNARLNWLVEISGGISDMDVVKGDKALEALLVKMDGKSMTDYKKMINERINLTKKEIDGIPARIDEQQRSIPEAADYDQTEKDLVVSKQDLAALEASELNAKEAMKPIIELHSKVLRLEKEKEDMIDLVLKEGNASRTDMSEKLQALVADQRFRESEIETLKSAISLRQTRVDNLNKDIVDLRTKYSDIRAKITELNADEFIPPNLSEESCPTCGQKLPSDMLHDKVEILRTAFDKKKTASIAAYEEQLKEINRTGKDNAAKVTELLAQSEADLKRLDEIGIHMTATDAEISRLRNDTLSVPSMLPAQAEQDIRVQAIDQQILALNIKLEASTEDRSAEILLKKNKVRQEIERLQGILSKRDTAKKASDRIAELEADLKAKGVTKTALEGDIFQCERFLRARTEKLEGKINGLFTKVGFKLFAEQVNGGLSETCEAVVNNTTFGKANTAGQINAGMDIIRTISAYKDIYVPVFVDRTESVDFVAEHGGQQILLFKPLPKFQEGHDGEEAFAILEPISYKTVGKNKQEVA